MTPEQALVEQAKAGDREALDQLILRSYPKCLNLARRYALEPEDITQIAFVKAWMHLEKFEGLASFSTWISRIIINESYANRQAKWPFDSLEELELLFKTGDFNYYLEDRRFDTENDAFREQIRVLLERALERLPPKQRQMVRLHFCEDWPVERVADHFQMNRNYTKAQIGRAMDQLRRAVLWITLPNKKKNGHSYPA